MFDDDDFEGRHARLERMPVYQKAVEIHDLVRDICELIDEGNELLNSLKWQLLDDACMLSVKIAGAEAGDFYDIRMECATLIRKSAMSLYVSIHSLRMYGFEHTEYYLMVREKIREFRKLFVEWVAGFDKTNYIADRWGLFNPPGVDVPDDDDDENNDTDWDKYDFPDDDDE